MKKPTILCVDDEQIVLTSLIDQLIHYVGNNYSIEVAESGEEALEVLEELSKEGIEVPLIISDQIMPGMKGDELLIEVQPVVLPKGFKPDVIVVDSLSAIASAFTGREDSYRIYIEQLFRLFEKMSVTAFLITETEQIPTAYSQSGVEEFLADGVIVLYNIKHGSLREGAIEILKMRGILHSRKIVAMQITPKGIEVFTEQEIFSGIK